MKNFIETLWLRNEALAVFGALNLLAALVFFILSRATHIEVTGVNAWYKPMKFALSTTFFPGQWVGTSTISALLSI